MGSIPGLGRSPGIGNGNPVQYISWEIPWTEEPGGLPSMGPQRVRYNLVTEKHQHILCTNQKTKRHWNLQALLHTHTHTHTHTHICKLFVIRIIFLIFHQRPKIKTSLLSLTSSFLITILLLLPKCFQFYHRSVSSQFPSPFWILPSFSSLWIPWCTEMQAQFLLPAYFSSMKLQGLDSCSIHLPACLLWCHLVVSSTMGAVPSHTAVILSLP